MAVNCCVSPAGTDATAGDTVTARSTAGVTVRAAVPDTDPPVAVMVTAPVATPVASPVDDTVAVGLDDDVHLTVSVRSWVEPSE